MRILFLTHSFNSLSQRLYLALTETGHEVSIEFDINDDIAEQAVELYQPELIVAPFLKRAIPKSIWSKHRCLIVHPGIKGDRGPSSLDWAIMNQAQTWGVTCLEANEEMDAGDIWASIEFPMRACSKSSLYRNEVTAAAVDAVKLAIKRIQNKESARPLDYTDPSITGQWNCLMTQAERKIDWANDTTDVILRKVRAADGVPGVVDNIAGTDYHLFNAYAETQSELANTKAHTGSIIASRDGALCFKTLDAAIWITHLKQHKPQPDDIGFKLPATTLLAEPLKRAPESHRVPEMPLAPETIVDGQTWQEIRYREEGKVGYLHFDFYNGAMDTQQCQRLQQAVIEAKQRSINVLVLMGGSEFWSNGIHLNQIEAAESPAEESWRNINAMNDLCLEIINSTDVYTMVAMQGNAGAGGVFLALAADHVMAPAHVVLNPHYKSMGNLYGSEYWTYLLPKRVGSEQAQALMQNRLPVSAQQAKKIGLLDDVYSASPCEYLDYVATKAQQLAGSKTLVEILNTKQMERSHDETQKPLAQYREEELAQMKLNFFGFDPSYHVARYHFVEKLPKARTPAYLAHHRRI